MQDWISQYFTGRASRKEWWITNLILIGTEILLYFPHYIWFLALPYGLFTWLILGAQFMSDLRRNRSLHYHCFLPVVLYLLFFVITSLFPGAWIFTSLFFAIRMFIFGIKG